MTTYYNEIDPFAAQWLRNLIAAGHIAPGTVDERSIAYVRPNDLKGFTQCHFFAGIGVWSHALRRAGWPDERPVWTGSCPCQPFSGAGTRGGTGDARHLWPVWYDLIRECGPSTIIGEQVASPDALGWWDIVSADLEAAGYPCAAIDLCAAGDGAPHIRQRLWWMAYAAQQQRNRSGDGRPRGWPQHSDGCGFDRLADASRAGLPPRQCSELPGAQRHDKRRAIEQCGSASGGVAHTNGGDASAERQQRSRKQRQQPEDRGAGGLVHAASERYGAHDLEPIAGRREYPARQADGALIVGLAYAHRKHERSADDAARGGDLSGTEQDRWTSPLHGFWRDADWLLCTDGRWRPVEPGTQPLAHGVAGRVGQLRAYGNAICAPLAQTFVEVVIDVLKPEREAMNQVIVKSFGSVEGARKYAGALRSSTRHISTGSTRDILKIDEHGEWHFGQDKTVVERDDVWAINPLTICHGYIAFENKKVAFDMDGEEAFISMSVTQELPEYDRLPELDTRPRKGEDPAKWAFQMSLEMVCVEGPNKGAEVLYSPTSAGGLRIIRIVAEEIARKFDDTDPGKIVPVVELDTARSYVNKKGKTIVPPAMHIIDWLGLDDDTFAAREEVKEDRDEPARGKRDVERTAKGDKVEQRRRREAPADEAPRRGAARTVESDEAEDSDVAEEPRRGRGRPRNDRDATPSEVERANIRGEVAHREARQAREAPVEDAPVASRGRRGARDRDEATADEADAPARGHSRRDDEDDRPARDSGRGRNIARSDIEHGVAPRGRRAAAGGRH